jgi:ankyrin repeat protein
LLISCGADVNASADEGCTPLHIATFKGQCPAILLLLEAGADVNARQMATTHSRDR